MFGLFKKKLPAQIRPGLEARANEAIAHIAGQVQGNRYMLQGGIIVVTDPASRGELRAAFKDLLTTMSRNRDNWPRQLKDLFDDYDKPNTTLYQKGAAHLLAGLMKTDIVCRAVDEYPDDKSLSDMATHVLFTNLSALDFILTGTHEHPLGEPTPATEILPELQYANALAERRLGFR